MVEYINNAKQFLQATHVWEWYTYIPPCRPRFLANSYKIKHYILARHDEKFAQLNTTKQSLGQYIIRKWIKSQNINKCKWRIRWVLDLYTDSHSKRDGETFIGHVWYQVFRFDWMINLPFDWSVLIICPGPDPEDQNLLNTLFSKYYSCNWKYIIILYFLTQFGSIYFHEPHKVAIK